MNGRVGEKGQSNNKRSTRKDKKKQLRPWLPGSLRAEINAITKFLNGSSRSSVMERILITTATNRRFIEYIKPYMKRTIHLPVSPDGMYYTTIIGNLNLRLTADDLYIELKNGVAQRASLYVTQELSETYLHPLTSGLDVSYDALATIALTFGVSELSDEIASGYRHKYIYRAIKGKAIQSI